MAADTRKRAGRSSQPGVLLVLECRRGVCRHFRPRRQQTGCLSHGNPAFVVPHLSFAFVASCQLAPRDAGRDNGRSGLGLRYDFLRAVVAVVRNVNALPEYFSHTTLIGKSASTTCPHHPAPLVGCHMLRERVAQAHSPFGERPDALFEVERVRRAVGVCRLRAPAE